MRYFSLISAKKKRPQENDSLSYLYSIKKIFSTSLKRIISIYTHTEHSYLSGRDKQVD